MAKPVQKSDKQVIITGRKGKELQKIRNNLNFWQPPLDECHHIAILFPD